MRKVLNNNNGYILAFALIISILIPVLFLSFITISANTTKQNEVVESTFQSQSIAEMGATYFKHAMTNEIETKKNIIIQNVIVKKQTDIRNKIYNNDSYYIDLAINDMKNSLDAIIQGLKAQPTDTNINIGVQQNPNNSFDITPSNGSGYFSANTNKLKIEYTSTGYDELKQAKIKGTIEVDFSNIFTTGPGGSSGSGKVIQYNTIPDPGESINNCLQNQSNFTKTTCKINGSISYHQNVNLTFNESTYRVNGDFVAGNLNNDFIDTSTLYIVNNMTAGNLNSKDHLYLHVGGKLEIGHINGSGSLGSIIEVGGSANMDNIKLFNSTMFIGGDTSIGQINGMDDSIIYIDSLANIKGADLGINSTICVNGHLDIGNINNNSGGSSNIYAISSNNSKVKTDSAAFTSACSGGGSGITPGNIIVKDDYDYSY